MVDNQRENLQWRISVNSTHRSNHIFIYIKEGLVSFVSRDYHGGGSMVFCGESLAQKCSRIESNEASDSFFYKIQKNKFNSSTDRQHDIYLLNMGRTQNKHLMEISKEIWGYLIERKIHLTAEYISSLSNQIADWTSRNFQDSNKQKLCPTVFKQICSHLGKPLLDLFPSRLYHQLPRYIAWRPDP